MKLYDGGVYLVNGSDIVEESKFDQPVFRDLCGMVLSRTQLLNQIWGYEFDGESRTVDVHIRTLRQKLGSAGDLIETVRGVGYKIGR